MLGAYTPYNCDSPPPCRALPYEDLLPPTKSRSNAWITNRKAGKENNQELTIVQVFRNKKKDLFDPGILTIPAYYLSRHTIELGQLIVSSPW